MQYVFYLNRGITMNFIKRCKIFVLASSLCLASIFSTPVCATEDPALASEIRYNKEIQSNTWENWPAGPQVYAESAIVMEASTGTILYSKSIDEQHYPASITKIMTALLTLENLSLDEEVTFSHNAVFSIDYGSSSIARDEGEILTVEECLYGLLLESANECANALAEKIAGSVEAFADMMNQRAAELGCQNTHFVNPHGLPNDDHYTTAHDMALITREAIKNEKFRQINSSSRYTLRATNKNDQELLMNNHHHMMSAYKTSKYLDETVFAGKTGYTTAALNTLVTCATRNGMDLIVVTMKTQGTGELGVPLFSDTANLLNYAGENFQKVNISQNEVNFTIGQNELFDTGSSVFGNTAPMIEMDTDGYVILPINADFSEASPQLEFVDTESSPVIANLTYTYAGQTIGSTELKLTSNEIQEFDSQTTDVPQKNEEDTLPKNTISLSSEKKDDEEVTLIKVNLRTVGIIVCSLLLLLTLILLIRKISIDFSLNLNPFSRWNRGKDEWEILSRQNERRRKIQRRKRRKDLYF